MKNGINILAILVLLFSVNIKNADAKDLSSLEEFDLFDSEIFSLSKKKEDAFDAPSATYVLTSNDIRRSGATSIPEALRFVPGLQVARIDASKWAITSRGFNDQFSNKLLIMVDGRVVYTPLFSGSFWDVQDYVLEDIDKIEVVRGPGATIWGANAVNGVINIITKDAVLTQGAYVSTIIGNQDKNVSVRYGGKTKNHNHYRLYAKQSYTESFDKLNSNGQDNDDGYINSRAGFRYDVGSVKGNNISIYGDIRQGKVDNYFSGVTASNSNRNDKDSKGANIAVNWDKTLSKKSRFTLKNYIDYDQFDTNVLSRTAKTYDVDFQHFYDFSAQNQFIWGAGYRLIKDAIKEDGVTELSGGVPLDYTPDKTNDEIFSGFIQDKIGLIADTLYLTLGSKFEHNDSTGSEYQPNVKLTFYPSRNQTIWSSISRAIRTPTRGENSINNALESIVGNQGFDAEEVTSYEFGYRVKPARSFLFDITTFYNDYNDLATYESDGTNLNIDNLGHGESYGVEISSKWQATNDWLLEIAYDFFQMDLHLRSNSNDFSLTEYDGESHDSISPKNQIKFKSNYNITPKLEFDNIIYYVDSIGTGVETESRISSYIRVDTRIGYLASDNLELSLVGQNLTDDRHQEFSAGLANNATEIGRTFYVRAVLDF